MKLSRPQRETVRTLYHRRTDWRGSDVQSFLEFRRNVLNLPLEQAVVVPVPWLGGFVVVEPDGYSHM